MKKQTIITACTFAAMTMATPAVFAVQPAMSNHVCASDAIKKDNRPVESKTTVPFQSRRRTNSTDTAAAEKSEAVMDVH